MLKFIPNFDVQLSMHMRTDFYSNHRKLREQNYNGAFFGGIIYVQYITRVFTYQSLISYTNWRFSQNNSEIDDSDSDTNSFNCMLST